MLIEQGAITPDGLATSLSFQFGVPVVDLKNIKIDPEAVRLVSEQLARQFNVVPLSVDGETLRVAMEDPSDLSAIDALSLASGKQIRAVLPVHGGLEQTINTNYRLTANIPEADRHASR